MLEKEDKKEIEKIVMKTVINALEQVILPRIQESENNTNERFDDTDASLNRIETLVTSEIKYVDELSKRVGVLEVKKV